MKDEVTCDQSFCFSIVIKCYLSDEMLHSHNPVLELDCGVQTRDLSPEFYLTLNNTIGSTNGAETDTFQDHLSLPLVLLLMFLFFIWSCICYWIVLFLIVICTFCP